jgi:hypothetical protein
MSCEKIGDRPAGLRRRRNGPAQGVLRFDIPLTPSKDIGT